MKKTTIAGGVLAAVVFVLLALVVGSRILAPALESDAEPVTWTAPAAVAPTPVGSETAPAAQRGFLYGRVTTDDGATYEGRLRWGGTQEAFWDDYFTGSKVANPWGSHVPPEHLEERRPIEVLGLELGTRKREVDLDRPFMVRFGDIVRIEEVEGGTERIERLGGDVRVMLKSGTAFVLDRLDAGDIDDGVRVWDSARGAVDLEPHEIRSIELLPTPRLAAAPDRLHGTVATRHGAFTGSIQWTGEERLGSDELSGRTAEGELDLPFDTIRSIARRGEDRVLVSLVDGREIELSGQARRGISVDDRRQGRVRIPWDVFERVDFHPGASGPAYGDFPPGGPLTGTVTTRTGRSLAGRLVFDLDESETAETLDASSESLSHTIPFGRVSSIARPDPESRDGQHIRVTLHDGEELALEPTGDLAETNAGLLIFADGAERPEYVPWGEVERIDLDRPRGVAPPLGGG